METLFSLANDKGYNVFLRSFALPYLNNFAKDIQSGKTLPFINNWRIGLHSLAGPIIFPGGMQSRKIVNVILSDYKEKIASSPDGTFFYIHWNLPHYPYIFNESGEMQQHWDYVGELISRPDSSKKYYHQLRGTDKVFGEVIEAIKKSGTYDKSLIIVTSDTNIAGYDLEHVPLIIKKPFQNNSHIMNKHTTFMDVFNYTKAFITQSGK